MQIIHWLFKVAPEKERDKDNSSIVSTRHCSNDQEGKDIVVYKRSRSEPRSSERGKQRKFDPRSYGPLAFLCRKDVTTACFHSTIHLKRIKSYNRRKQHWMWSMKMKKDEIVKADQAMSSSNKVDSSAAAHSGSKVLPITDNTSLSSSATVTDQCSSSEKVRGDKSKAMSRMKELIKWAAAAKSEKKGKFLGRKVLHFRNRASLKAVPDDDQMSNESPKISFRWDVESCSTITSSCSGISMADVTLSINSTPLHHRKGNWITTDSEFVVLEL